VEEDVRVVLLSSSGTRTGWWCWKMVVVAALFSQQAVCIEGKRDE